MSFKPNVIPKLGVILLSIILLTGISFIPVFQTEVYAQKQQPQQAPQQQNRVGLSQVIKQTAQQVATANPGTNATNVYQILVQLAKQTAQTSSQAEAIKEIRQISSQISTYPFGTLSQVISHFAKQVASGNSNVVQIAQQTVQEKASSSGSNNNITQSLSNAAIQQASGGSSNVNQLIRHAAQILANRAGVPVEKVEAVIIQMALQIAQAQGRAITAQSIFQLANQIIQNPNGVLALAILHFAKEDDGGKTGATTTIINQIVKTGGGNNGGGSGRDKRDSSESGSTTKINVNIIIQNIVQNAIINAAKGAKVDVKQTAGQIVKASDNKISQITAEKAVQRILLGLSTKANPSTIPDTMHGIVAATTMDPAISNKIANIAESSDVEDPTTSGAINDLTRDLASGKPANVALIEASIPDSASLVKDAGTTGGETSTDATTEGVTAFAGTEQQSSLSGPPPTTQDPNLIANPQEDPNLFQLSSPTEQKQTKQTTDETTSQGAAALGGEGTTTGGGTTAFAGGTTTTDTETDDGDGGETALNTDDTDADDTDTEDDGDSDDDDSSDGDSGDSGDDDGGDGDDGDGGGDSEEK